MVDKPIQKAIEQGTEAIEQTSKVLCPWLEAPKKCDVCGSYTDAIQAFVDNQAIVMDIWECPECGERYYRNRD